MFAGSGAEKIFTGGAVTLKSTNPFEAPVIDLELYTTDFDIQTMVQAMKTVDSFVHEPRWNGYVKQPLVQLNNDQDRADYARNNSITVNHSVGTARMGPGGVTGGVVDSSLRVKGVKGLRVVDASVFVSVSQTGYANPPLIPSFPCLASNT